MIDLRLGDCLEIMKEIKDHSIDLILCDLPYGTSACDFDKKVIDLNKLWDEYRRIIKPNRAIVLFAQQPFTTTLISSNMKQWKYNWIWKKDGSSNFLNSNYQPLKIYEDICVFGDGSTAPNGKEHLFYNPQFSSGKPYTALSGKQRSDSSTVGGKRESVGNFTTVNEGVRYPKNILEFNRDRERFHPTQKPISLCEYLIKTYSNEGDLVLDNCMGGGSTGVACKRLNRNFIGIELNQEYFNVAKERIKSASSVEISENEKIKDENADW